MYLQCFFIGQASGTMITFVNNKKLYKLMGHIHNTLLSS
jgi:hypothetical protein